MVKWAIVSRTTTALGEWHHLGTVAHNEITQHEDFWRNEGVKQVIVSNVSGTALRHKLDEIFVRMYLLPEMVEWIVSAPSRAGVENAYKVPEQLGCDRFAALLGAQAMYPDRNLVVATCGTATTVDFVSEKGVFVGGMILPGFAMMMKSLARNTANLPDVAQNSMQFSPCANNTADAIISGCIAAQIGAIEHAIKVSIGGSDDVTCLLSGGAVRALSPHLSEKHEIVDNLVLIGLHVATMAAA